MPEMWDRYTPGGGHHDTLILCLFAAGIVLAITLAALL